MCCISQLADGHECVAFQGLQVGMNGLQGGMNGLFHGLRVDMNEVH